MENQKPRHNNYTMEAVHNHLNNINHKVSEIDHKSRKVRPLNHNAHNLIMKHHLV